MATVAVATTTTLAADAGREAIAAGGNAVDAALASALVSINTEPGVCALAGGAYVTIWPADADPVTLDGYVSVPGRDSPLGIAGNRLTEVSMAYGGGVSTLVGSGSVATPGALAAIDAARSQYGRLSLADILQPSIRAAKQGFALSTASHNYLQYSGKCVFGRDAVSLHALHPDGENLLPPGGLVHLPGLADSLQGIADQGIELFYKGELAERICAHVLANGGCLSRADLAQYEVITRRAELVTLGDWQVALNPPPSIGGSVLGATLINLAQGGDLLATLRAVLQYRRGTLDFSGALSEDCRALLEQARDSSLLAGTRVSGSTVHTSAVDSNGLACAITASAGYGSGELPEGTGLWLNNCLGEIELNRRGFSAGPAGERLPSNMAPCVARSANKTLAIGSPGADRITSALAQTMQRYMLAGQSLTDAVNAPRLHVEVALEAAADTAHFAETLCLEPNVDVALPDDMARRDFDALSMYFGGVGAVAFDAESADNAFEIAADPRRTGGVCLADN